MCQVNPIPPEIAASSPDVQRRFRTLPYKERSCSALRFVVLTVVIGGIVAGLLYAGGNLTTLPQHLVQSVQAHPWAYLGGFGGFMALSLGTIPIFKKAKEQNDPLIETGPGKFRGDAHWKPMFFPTKNGPAPCHLDLSTLDENGNGKAYYYQDKDCMNHYVVNVMVAGFTVPHAVAAMAYNVVRAVIIPFYILGCMVVEKCKGEPIFEREFEWGDIPLQVGLSLWRVVRAPFYGLAMLYVTFYALVNPMNGRKLGYRVARQWNDGLTRAEGFWSIGGPQRHFKWEGGGDPDKLGQNGYIIAGCWHPLGAATFKEGKIVSGDSLGELVLPGTGDQTTIYTEDNLISQ